MPIKLNYLHLSPFLPTGWGWGNVNNAPPGPPLSHQGHPWIQLMTGWYHCALCCVILSLVIVPAACRSSAEGTNRSCCLLAADVVVCDKYSVFVGTVSLSVWKLLDLATSVSCPEEKNLCTCLCLCRLKDEKKKKETQEANVESFAKMGSSHQGMLRPLYLPRPLTLPLFPCGNSTGLQRCGGKCMCNEAGDWCGLPQHVPAKHHLEASAAASSLIICRCLIHCFGTFYHLVSG